MTRTASQNRSLLVQYATGYHLGPVVPPRTDGAPLQSIFLRSQTVLIKLVLLQAAQLAIHFLIGKIIVAPVLTVITCLYRKKSMLYMRFYRKLCKKYYQRKGVPEQL